MPEKARAPRDEQVETSVKIGLLDKRMTRKKLCELLDMSERSLGRKLKEPDSFTFREIRILAEVLDIPKEKVLIMIYG